MALEANGSILSIDFNSVITIILTVLVSINILWLWIRDERPYSGFPVFGKEEGDWMNKKTKERFQMHATRILKDGLIKHKGPFQVFAPHGPTIVLPHKMLDDVRNDDRLLFSHASRKLFIDAYPGLEPFHLSDAHFAIFVATLKQNLTTSFDNDTAADFAAEMQALLPDILPPSRVTQDTWTSVPFVQIAPVISARLSAKLFLGEPICHNQAWLDISITYTHHVGAVVRRLRTWPSFLRGLVMRVMPEAVALRAQVAAARSIIEPVVLARRQARREGKQVPKATDTLGWMEEQSAKRGFADGAGLDPVEGQLLLTFVAIHTTSTTLTGVLYDLVGQPETLAKLRREIVEVLTEDGGWKKTSPYKMKLMDSCLKESQRLHPINSLHMNRRATEPVTLSDGTRLPKGALIGIPTYMMRDSSFYENPDTFDGERFLRMRQRPGMEAGGQFVSTSSEHIGFGHGKHSCAGRFFASNELKFALAYLVMKYDWRFEDNAAPETISLIDYEFVPDPQQLILVKAREPELDLFK